MLIEYLLSSLGNQETSLLRSAGRFVVIVPSWHAGRIFLNLSRNKIKKHMPVGFEYFPADP
jgi:hypothetical protein